MRLFLAAMILLASSAFAGDNKNVDVDVTQSNDMNNQTSGDITNNIAGDSSKAFGIGHSLGDVDIAQCLGSEQWGSPVFSRQKLVINWPCMAEFYLRNGMPDLAAMAVCNTEVVKEFKDEAECEAAHQFLAAVEPAAPPIPEAHIEEEEEFHEEQMMLYEDLQAKIANLEAEVNKPPPPPRVIRETVQQGGLTEEQKAALREVVK